MVLSSTLSGCAGIHYSHLSSDIPGLADALEPVLVSGPNHILCNRKDMYQERTAERYQGVVLEGARYSEACASSYR